MSFILDALKRSENERQEQANAEFAAVPSSPDAPGTPRWLWVLGTLLAINAMVLLGLMLRPDRAPESAGATAITAPPPESPAAPAPTTSTPSFDEQVAAARRSQPPPTTADSADTSPTPAASSPAPAGRNIVATDNLRVTRAADLPTLTELRATGRLQLPELHLDIHVYNDLPSERFVFINMDKYQEGSQLSAGPVVQEITNDGVILEYQNIDFLLLRD